VWSGKVWFLIVAMLKTTYGMVLFGQVGSGMAWFSKARSGALWSGQFTFGLGCLVLLNQH
jgi:hypothetical protein